MTGDRQWRGAFFRKGSSFGEGRFVKILASTGGDPPVLSRRNPDICGGKCGYINQEFESKNSVFLKLQLKKLYLR